MLPHRPAPARAAASRPLGLARLLGLPEEQRVAVASALLHAAACHLYAQAEAAELAGAAADEGGGGGSGADVWWPYREPCGEPLFALLSPQHQWWLACDVLAALWAPPEGRGGGGGGGTRCAPFGPVGRPRASRCERCSVLCAAQPTPRPVPRNPLNHTRLALGRSGHSRRRAPRASPASPTAAAAVNTPLHASALLALTQLLGIHAAAEARGEPPPAWLLETRVAHACRWLPACEELFASVRPPPPPGPRPLPSWRNFGRHAFGYYCDPFYPRHGAGAAPALDARERERLALPCGLLLVKRGAAAADVVRPPPPSPPPRASPRGAARGRAGRAGRALPELPRRERRRCAGDPRPVGPGALAQPRTDASRAPPAAAAALTAAPARRSGRLPQPCASTAAATRRRAPPAPAVAPRRPAAARDRWPPWRARC
jgi:hypothetical protein